jgi:DNA/RNA endonuclease G (NUC1)
VVTEKLNRQVLADAAGNERTNHFFADPRLPSGNRAEPTDYSGYDRGHMAPAADQPNQTAMEQSFILTNIVPQDSINNQKIWSKIESDVRKYIRRAQGNVFVFSGPIFSGPQRHVGKNEVWVPSHLFKLVYDESTGRSWAYILENKADAQIAPPVSYDQFVQATGWNLLAGAVPMSGEKRSLVWQN